MFGPFDGDRRVSGNHRVPGRPGGAGPGALGLSADRNRPAVSAAAMMFFWSPATWPSPMPGYVFTVPQAFLTSKPEGSRSSRPRNARDPSPGPFRVHRMPLWNPPGWNKTPHATG